MKIERITEFDEKSLQDLDALMHELSPGSSCTKEHLMDVINDPNSYLIVVRDTQHSEPKTQNTKLNTQNPTPNTQNPKPNTQNPKPNTQNCESRFAPSIIACGTLCVMHTPEMKIGAIEAVVVNQKYRGQGIGKQIMEELLNIAQELSPITLHLTSNPARQAANRLYQKIGFLNKETNYYSMALG